jgi:hypothetical protein
MDDTDDLDFIEGEKKRTVSKIEISSRQQHTVVPNGLCSLDMRINKIEINDDNVATIVLAFKLDYYPERKEDVYTIYLIHNISVYDKNRVLEKDPTGDLSIGYMARHYKESGERLFKELHNKSKALSNPIKGDFTISDEEAERQVEIVMTQFFRK